MGEYRRVCIAWLVFYLKLTSYRTSVADLINQPVSKLVCGDENDKDVFIRATEVMKTDESSYRVRFVTQRPKGFTSLHSSRNVSAHNLAALTSGSRIGFSFSHSNTDLASIHSSYSDLRLSTLNYPSQERSYSVASGSPISTPRQDSYEIPSPERSPSYHMSEWLPEEVKSPLVEAADDDIEELLEMEGQGVLIYDHTSGEPSHVSTCCSSLVTISNTLDHVDPETIYPSETIECRLAL